jgi:hypothetical protein
VRRLAACLLALGLLAACASPPKEGYVRDKDFTAAHWESGYRTEYTTEPDCGYESVYDSTTGRYEQRYGCTTKQVSHEVYEAHHTWVDDSWRMRLEDCKVNAKDERKCKTGWREVTEAVYDRYDLGQHYPDAR